MDVNLIGNPNTGKTTLFNTLTKSNEHVGNWHGVTVSQKTKIFKFNGEDVRLTDLPGLYSLTSLSYEEEVAAGYVREFPNTAAINICDENNLPRNLYLTLSLMELGVPLVLAINKVNKDSYVKVNEKKLSKELRLGCYKIDAEKASSLEGLKGAVLNVLKVKYKLPYLEELPLNEIKDKIEGRVKDKTKLDFIAIKILERDENIIENLNLSLEEVEAFVPKNSIELVAKARFEYISKLENICMHRVKKTAYGYGWPDKLLLNRFLAFPIFFAFMAGIFYLTFFSFGAFLSDALGSFLSNVIGAPIVNWLNGVFGGGWFVDLVDVGIIGGAVSLISFLPQIVLLFFFLSILEDSGYLARIAFCFEDIFSKVGLSGKSVYTLLMGFGCSTTAVLTARNMENKNAKIKTALLTPYMSCSAKLPIYAVLGGAFFGASNVFYVLLLYIIGIVVAILLSLIFEKTVLKSKEQSFILEFPPYRISSFKRIFGLLWQNVKAFLVRIGSLIVCMNVIIWVLGNFSFSFIYVSRTGGESALETLGRFFAPIFAPLGFNNWGLVAALFAGMVAKEVVVSSIAMFNGIEGTENPARLIESIKNTSSAVFLAGPAAALSYMVFCLLYTPCLASVSVLNKEIGAKWTFRSILIQLTVAYFVAALTYLMFNIIDRFGIMKCLGVILGFLILTASIWYVARRFKKGCKNCTADCKNCPK